MAVGAFCGGRQPDFSTEQVVWSFMTLVVELLRLVVENDLSRTILPSQVITAELFTRTRSQTPNPEKRGELVDENRRFDRELQIMVDVDPAQPEIFGLGGDTESR